MYDKIAKLSVEKFNSLPKTGKPKPDEWTVLSSIICEENSNFEVVSLGTGLKCIGKNKMSKNGDILNDSHAEIICRRAFLCYLYEQIDNCLNGKKSIFVKEKNFKLINVKFHFFTTLMPCGDSSIFEKNFEIDIFRTGAKCLADSVKQDPLQSGVNYHVTEVVRTKPGRGDPTLSVSCSDKITKWCHLGIQGALLTLLIEPVYLSSLIIAKNTPYSKESLQRTLFNRIQQSVPENFEIFQSNVTFDYQKNETKKTCPSSIIWYKNDTIRNGVEIAVDGKKQGVTKKNQNSDSARLKICKFELFKQFLKYSNGEFSKLNYAECKEKAVVYMKNWKILKEKLGAWPEKDRKLLEFYCKNEEIVDGNVCKRRKLNC